MVKCKPNLKATLGTHDKVYSLEIGAYGLWGAVRPLVHSPPSQPGVLSDA